MTEFRSRQSLGKYRIIRRLGSGGFSFVYEALDTIEGTRVALKVPRGQDERDLKDVRREIKVAARLQHPAILALKDASEIDGHLVMVYPLGGRTLAERQRSRMSTALCIEYARQMLEGLAYAHQQRIIHCDVKPENFILFPEDKIQLTDFGIAKISARTIRASGSGTVGYMAPEQAMGKPSCRSDVFAMGLVLYRMFAGELPEWPFERPFPGDLRLRRRMDAVFVAFLHRALDLNPRKRFRDAGSMLNAFVRLEKRYGARKTEPRARRATAASDWRTVRKKQFIRLLGSKLETKGSCAQCNGPIAESMTRCPWCARAVDRYRARTRFPRRCTRCGRGAKLDWKYCAWCYGGAIGPASEREWSDVRYVGRCNNTACDRKDLMPFMHYCPWCRRKVAKKWTIEGVPQKCRRCGWGIAADFWNACPWCGLKTEGGAS